MVARRENFLFGKGALDLVSLDHLFLAQDCGLNELATEVETCFLFFFGGGWGGGVTFHGVESVALLFSHQIHFTHVTFTNKLDFVEAGGTNFNIADLDRVGTVCPAEGQGSLWRRQVTERIFGL